MPQFRLYRTGKHFRGACDCSLLCWDHCALDDVSVARFLGRLAAALQVAGEWASKRS